MSTNEELIAVASYLSSDGTESNYGIAVASDDTKSCQEGTCGQSADCGESACTGVEGCVDGVECAETICETCQGSEDPCSGNDMGDCSESTCTDACEIATQTCGESCSESSCGESSSDEPDISGVLFTAIANAIRYKNGTTATITANDFPVAIAAIPSTYTSTGATYTDLPTLFTDIADAIRAKTGDTTTIVASNFPSAILEIPTTITFIVNDIMMGADFPITHTTESGTTWNDYYSNLSSGVSVSSGYIVYSFSVDGKTYVDYYLTYDSTKVVLTDLIIAGATYSWSA